MKNKSKMNRIFLHKTLRKMIWKIRKLMCVCVCIKLYIIEFIKINYDFLNEIFVSYTYNVI